MKKHFFNLLDWGVFDTIRFEIRPFILIHLCTGLILIGVRWWIGVCYVVGTLTIALFSPLATTRQAFQLATILAPIVGMVIFIIELGAWGLIAIYMLFVVIAMLLKQDPIDLEFWVRNKVNRILRRPS